MITDFRDQESGQQIEADICIVGGGAAGITVAKSFIGTGIQICLLESGGFELEAGIQELYDGENVGFREYFTLTTSRLRYFGGSTNHWGGWCGPLNTSDFEDRPWVELRGWPITREELDPYYTQAQNIIGLGPFRYDVDSMSDNVHRYPEFDREKLVTRFWQYSSPPTAFGKAYRAELEQADNIRVCLHANVTRFETNEYASIVERASIQTLEGKTGSVRAKYFIVACGGLETARILLLSNTVETAGLGNRYDKLGRYYMIHPHTRSAAVRANDPAKLAYIYQKHFHSTLKVPVCAGLAPSTAAQKAHGILNCSVTVEAVRPLDTGYDALKDIEKDIDQRKWPEHLSKDLWEIITDLGPLASRAYSHASGHPYYRPVMDLRFETRTEQLPNPESRISLSETKDRLGLNRIRQDLRFSEVDKQTVRVTNRLIGEELGRLNLGRVRLLDWLTMDDVSWPGDVSRPGPETPDDEPHNTFSYGHHMGTTRMSEAPSAGVVDRNCRVHSVSNLYVASSSVFPTSGFVNPTLTIVALSLRLSEHIKKQFDQPANT
jgi:choline dehydrogenase-like flavoprotein